MRLNTFAIVTRIKCRIQSKTYAQERVAGGEGSPCLRDGQHRPRAESSCRHIELYDENKAVQSMLQLRSPTMKASLAFRIRSSS